MIKRNHVRLPSAVAISTFTALLAVGGVALATRTYRVNVRIYAAHLDSARTALREARKWDAEQVHPGDTLPHAKLVGRDQKQIWLSQLPSHYKYLYFGRVGCPPCELLEPFWAEIPQARLDSVAFIEFDPAKDSRPRGVHAQYAWLHDTRDTRQYVDRVPTLIVRSPGGRVLTVAHGSIFSVGRVLDVFGLMSAERIKARVDSARKRVANGLAAPPAKIVTR